MKHPSYEVLQDYFENALKDEHRVKAHLLNCDQCTKVLADFAVIEQSLQKQGVFTPGPQVKQRIFQDAKLLLKEKRQRQEWLSEYIKDWKIAFPELKIPALQLASLSLVLTVLVSVEKNQGTFEEIYEPISSDVTVYTVEE